MALRTAEKGLFGPFCRPYIGQINGWSIAQITFRTVSLGDSVNNGVLLSKSKLKIIGADNGFGRLS